MLRLKCLSRFKSLVDNPQLISQRLENLSLTTSYTSSRELGYFSKNWTLGSSNGCSRNNPALSSLSSPWTPRDKGDLPGGLISTLREYHVGEGSIKWRRRRDKAMEQRKKVLNPSSPVIDQRVPLPPHDGDKFPELFGYQDLRNPMKDQREVEGVVTEINRQIESKDYGRLFAVINVKGKQFKVTTEDIIILQGYWAPNVGERLRLHKILLVGGGDFTITGRPLLDDNLIRVEGTVIEKTLSYTKLHFRLKKRKNFRRLKFSKDAYTMLRINMIELLKPIAIPEAKNQEVDPIIDVNYRVTMNK